ncbi:hypothetical protein ABW19_dt0206537 [Dactylella cylindrospora]|nr:hypothetical protein ABW19_dt0206537 [Dactylella cylindrospora]
MFSYGLLFLSLLWSSLCAEARPHHPTRRHKAGFGLKDISNVARRQYATWPAKESGTIEVKSASITFSKDGILYCLNDPGDDAKYASIGPCGEGGDSQYWDASTIAYGPAPFALNREVGLDKLDYKGWIRNVGTGRCIAANYTGPGKDGEDPDYIIKGTVLLRECGDTNAGDLQFQGKHFVSSDTAGNETITTEWPAGAPDGEIEDLPFEPPVPSWFGGFQCGEGTSGSLMVPRLISDPDLLPEPHIPALWGCVRHGLPGGIMTRMEPNPAQRLKQIIKNYGNGRPSPEEEIKPTKTPEEMKEEVSNMCVELSSSGSLPIGEPLGALSFGFLLGYQKCMKEHGYNE